MELSEIKGWSVLDGADGDLADVSSDIISEAVTVGHLVVVSSGAQLAEDVPHPRCVSAWRLKCPNERVTLADITRALEKSKPHMSKRLGDSGVDVHYTIVTPQSMNLVTHPNFVQRMTDAMTSDVAADDGVRIWTRPTERLPTFPSGRIIAGDDRVRRIIIDTSESAAPVVITLLPSLRMDAATVAFPPLNRDPSVLPTIEPLTIKEQCNDWLAQNWVWLVLGILIAMCIVFLLLRNVGASQAPAPTTTPSAAMPTTTSQ